MKHYFEAITIGLEEAGCTDPDAINYNPNATINTGVCFDAAFEECVYNNLFSVSLRDCSLEHTKRVLKIYAIYDGYKQAVREANQTKIDIYTEQLTNMCNAEYCESC